MVSSWKYMCSSQPFCSAYSIKEDSLKKFVVDQAISWINKTLTVPVEGMLVFKDLVDKRPEDQFETLRSLAGPMMQPDVVTMLI